MATSTQFNGFSNKHDIIYINTESTNNDKMHSKALWDLHQEYIYSNTIPV
jgi:ornithine decarboxylase